MQADAAPPIAAMPATARKAASAAVVIRASRRPVTTGSGTVRTWCAPSVGGVADRLPATTRRGATGRAPAMRAGHPPRWRERQEAAVSVGGWPLLEARDAELVTGGSGESRSP